MVCDEYKCIFVHIIKTGGTSIERLLRKSKHHVYAKYYKKRIGCERWDKYFKFTFVRNPWDKMVSQYFYLQRKLMEGDKNLNLTFREFIVNFSSFDESEYTTQHERHKAIKIRYNPVQLPWILNDDGNCMVDFIGRFENLQHDFNTVCDRIGLPGQQLPHKNKSEHKHYTEYYDDETRQIVAEKFAEDIEYFGYVFEGKQ